MLDVDIGCPLANTAPLDDQPVEVSARQTLRPAVRIAAREQLQETPWVFDWFALMRRIEAHNRGYPRLGVAVHPQDEPVRVGQAPTLSFASASLSSAAFDAQGRFTIQQLGFGLYGPNGALPLHITEYVRERIAYDDDHAQAAFSDIFHHRFAMLFYRAWASAQPTNSLDRPDDDTFSNYVGSLSGYGEASMHAQDRVPDHAKRYFSGHLVRLTRNPEGLRSILQSYFDCEFHVQEWLPQWLNMEPHEQTQLGQQVAAAQLGMGAVCGASVLDRQHKFRLHAGPMDLKHYEDFLPKARHFGVLRDWVRNYIGYEFSWDLRLVLRHQEVPPLMLGSGVRLGWTTWLGQLSEAKDRGDLVLQPETHS